MAPKSHPRNPILIVDDEAAILLSIETTLQIAGLTHTLTCRDSRNVMNLLSDQVAEVILLDLTMPHIDGQTLLEQINQTFPEIPVIVVTGAVDVETAVGCMKSGAFDYVVKPVDADRLITSVQRAIAFRDLKRENVALKQRILSEVLDRPDVFTGIITRNKKMLSIFQYVESIAPTRQPVLVQGETGVGKELVAYAIHELSGSKGPFVPVNVAGLDDNVFSDTLFGHVKGAFTGADRDRAGLIEQAAGGTLFLDEIGDLSQASQVKLLRLVQEGEYLPLGEDAAKKTDTRIVASTNVDLWERQKAGQFRSDLNYRLQTHRIFMPPLRERMEDMPLLVSHFIDKAARSLGRDAPAPPAALLALLNSYAYPGNLRELQTMIFDAVSQEKTEVLSLHVFENYIQLHQQREASYRKTRDPAPSEPTTTIQFPHHLPTIKAATQMLVDEAMKRSGQNQSIAAKMLGITQQALSKRLIKKKSER